MASLVNYFNGNFTQVYIVVVSACLGISFVVYFILSNIFKLLCNRIFKDECILIQKKMRAPVYIFSVVLSLGLPFSIFDINPEKLTNTRNALIISFIFSITFLILRSIKVLKVFLFLQIEKNFENHNDIRKYKTQFEILEKVIVISIVFMAIVLSLMVFEPIRRIGVSLFASAGVAGIIIGFSAQKLIAAVISGIQLAVTQPIKINDIVVVENEWGIIEEINLTYVVVTIWDKRRLVLPSTYFIDKHFYNWSRTTPELLVTVFLHVDYTVPVEELRIEFTRLVHEHPDWDGDVCVLQVSDATNRNIEVRCLFGVKDATLGYGFRAEIREKMIQFIQKNYPGSLPKTRIEIGKDD